ncbi:MAG: N-acetylmuramoyl-L-alanine amidase [bacterium]|nr:N-acetylmuramoyl-L-alanine amidase [bacterium]
MGYTRQAIALLQTNLVAAGQDIGAAGVDGLAGPGSRTEAAVTQQWGGYAGGFAALGVTLGQWGEPDWGRYLAPRFGAQYDAYAAEPVDGIFVPVGVLIHHTGVSDRDRIPPERMIDGRSSLSGPIVQAGASYDGWTAIYTNGRAHHAGQGSSRVVEALREGKVPPKPGPDDVSGNTYFLGIEMDGPNPDGFERFDQAQLQNTARVAAAWCDVWQWPTSSVLGHKEWTKRKVDPDYDMDVMREMVDRFRGSSPREPGWYARHEGGICGPFADSQQAWGSVPREQMEPWPTSDVRVWYAPRSFGG